MSDATPQPARAMRVTLSERLDQWRFALIPDHVVGEVLSKRWIENLVPFTVLVAILILFGNLIPDFFASANLSDTMRQFGEYGLVALAMTIVMIGGGIDLSVGSTFALANIIMLILTGVFGWGLGTAIPVTLVACALVGLCNGILVGYLRLRAFLTTLVTLIIVRALVDILLLNYSVAIAGNFFTTPVWDFIGYGNVWIVPSSMALFGVLAIAIHIMLTRLRLGWYIKSVGGSRRGAYNVGVPVRRTVCITYVFSGILSGMAGILYAARLGSAGADVGFGLEVAILTGVVLGGNSLGGGRGSVAKAAMGTLAVLIITNGMVTLGLKSGATQLMLGLVLLFAIAVDVKWLKNRHKFVSTAYMAPTYFRLAPLPDTSASSKSVYAMNNRLRDVELIGLGQLEGPEDVVFDSQDNLYTGTRWAISCGSARPTTTSLRSSPISAAIRSAWRWTPKTGCMSASPAWAFIASIRTERCPSRRMKPTAAGPRSSTTARSGWPMTSTSRRTVRSGSPRRPSAIRSTLGRMTHWRAAAMGA